MDWIKRVFVLAVFAFSFQTSEAQETASNVVYFEFYGNGGFYTVNYEKSVHIKDEAFNIRIGFGTYNLKMGDFSMVQRIGLPLGVNKGFKISEAIEFELGLGLSYIRGMDIRGIRNDNVDITEPSQGIYFVPSAGILIGKNIYFSD